MQNPSFAGDQVVTPESDALLQRPVVHKLKIIMLKHVTMITTNETETHHINNTALL